ncbi:hypothetical protein KIN20_005568 [Parelaphostrongylus tenuis]|uniref:Uncharacterized protein n=1 Tax=Parelaphostrongylus tenuis TaxID=148309 RepID=A0AAD5M4R5_PARTN|nr:hypothetical protein KIN20_005568 [Parelaphostrongylus tenuis]
MTSTCLCRKSGRQSECVVITRQWSQEAVQRDVDFFKFVEQHSVPVFVAEKDKQVGERAMLPGSKRNAEGE